MRVLRLLNTIGWIEVARQSIAYACEHSQRLIVDLRGNGGGNDTVIQWLYQHLFPREQDAISAGKLPLRLRNDSPTFNEILFNSALFDSLAAPQGVAPCQLSTSDPAASPICRRARPTGHRRPHLVPVALETHMEMFGAYLKDLTRLHIEVPVESDVRVDVWSDSPTTDGYVYRHVLEAVDRRCRR